MYAMVCTSTNLGQAVNMMRRYIGELGKEHWQDMKCIFKYLKGTTDIGLVYQGDASYALVSLFLPLQAFTP